MEVNFRLRDVLNDELTILNLSTLRKRIEKLDGVIDRLGVASARAQGLAHAITSATKVKTLGHTVYLLTDLDSNRVLGFAKTGRKKLFLHDWHGKLVELTPICLLDFYVHESCQRSGCGIKMMSAVLKNENINAYELAIDRPSAKCISFFAKHYNLREYRDQANNYVVFKQFFTREAPSPPVRPAENKSIQTRSFLSQPDKITNNEPLPTHRSPQLTHRSSKAANAQRRLTTKKEHVSNPPYQLTEKQYVKLPPIHGRKHTLPATKVAGNCDRSNSGGKHNVELKAQFQLSRMHNSNWRNAQRSTVLPMGAKVGPWQRRIGQRPLDATSNVPGFRIY